jgi:hypothetical protein
VRRPIRIGPIIYDNGLPLRVRIALWIAPELEAELIHYAEQTKQLGILHSVMTDR